MARTRRANARGTRRSSGIESGVSFGTNPSGVTIGSVGIDVGSGLITLAQLNYLDGLAAYNVGHVSSGKLMTSGVSAYTGSTLSIVTGLTTLEIFVGSLLVGAASTNPLTMYASNINTIAGSCSVAVRYDMGIEAAGAPACYTNAANGCTVEWIAIGT